MSVLYVSPQRQAFLGQRFFGAKVWKAICATFYRLDPNLWTNHCHKIGAIAIDAHTASNMEVKLMSACSKNVNIPTPPHPNPTCSVSSNMEVKLMCACTKNVNIPTPPHPSPTCCLTSNMEVKLMCACSKNVNIPTPPHPNHTYSVTSNMEVKLMCACSKNVNIPTPPHPSPTCSVTSNMALWHGCRNWHTRKASYRPWHPKQLVITCIETTLHNPVNLLNIWMSQKSSYLSDRIHV